MMGISKNSILLLLCLLLLVSSCKFKDLHHGLVESDADEVLVMLHENGIEARKEPEKTVGQETTWKVVVETKRLEQARQFLVTNHLPRRKELGLSGVYKEKGLIPTPDEQKARFLLALKGEIINSLKKIPGVVEADVVLNLPTENEFAELDPVKKRPTASVVVRTRGEIDMSVSVTEGKLQRFVANTVPNMDPNDVTVIVTRMPAAVRTSKPVVDDRGLSPFPTEVGSVHEKGGIQGPWVALGGVKMEASSIPRFKMYMIILLVLLLTVSIGLLASLVRINRLKAQVQGETMALTPYEGEPGMLQDGHPSMEGTFNVGNKVTK